jgi:hypothetical protein
MLDSKEQCQEVNELNTYIRIAHFRKTGSVGMTQDYDH